MATPLIAFVALIGGTIAYHIQGGGTQKEVPKIAGTLSVLLPLIALWEAGSPSVAPTYKVSTAVKVKAAPSDVWHRVVSFPPMDKPTEFMFRAGIAYPTHATISWHRMWCNQTLCF